MEDPPLQPYPPLIRVLAPLKPIYVMETVGYNRATASELSRFRSNVTPTVYLRIVFHHGYGNKVPEHIMHVKNKIKNIKLFDNRDGRLVTCTSKLEKRSWMNWHLCFHSRNETLLRRLTSSVICLICTTIHSRSNEN